MNTAKIDFIRWLKARRPDVFAKLAARHFAMGEVAPAPAGEKSAIDSIFSILEKSLPIYLGTKQADALIKINIERAKKGLEPIDAAAFQPGVSVTASKDVQYIMWAGVAMVGIVAYFMFSKGRR